MSFATLLRNTVVLEARSVDQDETGEEVETFDEGSPIPASVQDRTPTQLTLPDIDGPVIVNATVFTTYADGRSVRHLDVLRQTDVNPARRYQVIFPDDGAGIHHHFEFACRRIETIEEFVS